MKKIISVALIAFVITACNNSTESTTTTDSTAGSTPVIEPGPSRTDSDYNSADSARMQDSSRMNNNTRNSAADSGARR
jgi:hypothetical protein